MVFKHFRFLCAVRALLLTATIFALVYLWNQRVFAATLLAGALVLFQVISLIHFVEKTNRDLQRFLFAIRHADFSQTFTSAGLGASFQELKSAFSEVLHQVREARAEREEQYRYLQTIVQHIGIGLIVYRPGGEVQLMNSAAQKVLQQLPGRNGKKFQRIRSLDMIGAPLRQTLLDIKSGEKALVKWQGERHPMQVSVFATELRLRGQKYKLASLQDIYPELEEKEVEAWQKLIRVLTHEIMNSITPISSLALTAGDLLSHFSDRLAESERTNEHLTDIRTALQTIQKRSQGLLHFVEAYRKLAHVPRPNFAPVALNGLFAHLEPLVRAQIGERPIQLEIVAHPASLQIMADQELLEQVLLNLVSNAIHAVDSRPGARIELRGGFDERGHTVIQVRDNGPGIPADIREKIFIPFFTTRTEGTGIGLSLCRQIMRLHRGTISVQSKPGVETVITLRF